MLPLFLLYFTLYLNSISFLVQVFPEQFIGNEAGNKKYNDVTSLVAYEIFSDYLSVSNSI